MRPRGAAAVAVGLWVLVTVSVAADPGVAAPRRCLLSHYRSLEPRALAAVKALRDRYEEETLSWRPRNCSFRPRRDPPRPSSCARLRLVARGLADAQAVLKRLPSPELFPGFVPTLELLAAAGRDVAACLELVRPGSWRKSLRPPRRRRPQTRRADSPRCHEATVIFNLLRLLTWDLRLVAHPGPCL
ncbi:interferon lambda-4-like [Hipposideros larvatus]